MEEKSIEGYGHKDITFSLGNAWATEYCNLAEYLDFCCDSHPVLALFPQHLILSASFLFKGWTRVYCSATSEAGNKYPEPNFSPSYSNGSPFSTQEILSCWSQSQPLWQKSGITRRCRDLASCWCFPGAMDLWKHGPGIQGLIHTHGICTSALVARWTYRLLLAIPKSFVHHSLQEQLHICHSDLHLHLPAMSPGAGFNPALKPQELKYKSVLILEDF